MSGHKPEGNDIQSSKIAHPDFQPRRRTPWGTVEGRVISLVSRKGGVGKTTSAVNLGAALALSGHTVLVVGTDPQCGVCRTLGTPPHELTTCLSEIHTGNQPLTDIVHPSPLKGLFFISPRILTLEEEESYLHALESDPDTFIREIDRARHLYDTILIDCPPGLGAATKASLLASDSFLVPLQAEELCRDSVDSLLEFVDTFRDRVYRDEAETTGPFPTPETDNPLGLEGIFLTMASNQTRMGRHVAARVIEDFGAAVFDTAVPRNTRLSEMALLGKPAVIYDRRSPGSRAYFNLADELLQRFTLSEVTMGVGQESSLPDRTDSLAPAGDTHEEASWEMSPLKIPAADGLDRLLSELGESGQGTGSFPFFEKPTGPEIVSLDELLAEEENRNEHTSGDEEWDEGLWNPDRDSGGQIN
jgi:chromosome partitioning protein